MQPTSKSIADRLTQLRAILGLSVAWRGLLSVADSLTSIVTTVIVCWLTDLLDGPLARRAAVKGAKQTWTGAHDEEADLSISVGLMIYLVSKGRVVLWLGCVWLVLTLGLWLGHSRELGWPFYTIPYVLLLHAAFNTKRILGGLLVGYLLIAGLLRWRRIWDDYIPSFFDMLRGLGRGTREEIGAPSEGDIQR